MPSERAYYTTNKRSILTIEDTIKSRIRSIPDFPKQGITFRDITTLISNNEGFKLVIDEFVKRYSAIDIDIIAGIEARGFILGGAVANQLDKGFVPIRKAGKLPYKTVSYEYNHDFGTSKIEIHVDSIKNGDRVLIIDDLLATGGTSLASAKLVEKLGSTIVELAFIVDIPDNGGTKAIIDAGYNMFALCEFKE